MQISALLLSVVFSSSPTVPDAELLLKEVQALPESADRWAKEARLRYYLAEGATSREVRREQHESGLTAAKKALALDDRHPEAILWSTAHRGSQATALNPFQAVRIAREVEKAMQKLKIVAPEHDYAAADRVLGQLYLLAPPGISVGSKEKAKKHLEAALKAFPTYAGNRLAWAGYLLKTDGCKEAKQIAQEISTAKPAAEFALDAPLWKRQADQILADAGSCE